MSRKKAVEYGITQLELEAYREANEAEKRAAAEVKLRRSTLMARVDAGAVIEPGSLTAQITTREVHRFTADAVAAILGVDVVAEVRSQIPPSVDRIFAVVEVT